LQGTAKLKGCYTLPRWRWRDPAKVQRSLDDAAAQGGHGYVIRKLNGAGASLGETPWFSRKRKTEKRALQSSINSSPSRPNDRTANSARRSGSCRMSRDANAPVVNSVTAVYDNQGPSLRIVIDATDADNDSLRFFRSVQQ
jgi:hypothetical protein